MPIPQFKYVIKPLLEYLADGQEHSLKEAESSLAIKFNLKESDLSQMTPSGRMTIFSNRVGWAKTYLKKAGLVDAPKKALFKITPQGQKVLAQKPEIIDPSFLRKFSSFNEFQGGADTLEKSNEVEDLEENTPEETMEAGYQSIVKELYAELLNSLKSSSPAFFEQSVIDLLLGMGYGGSRKDAGQAIGRSGDGGIDGVIKEDKLGLDLIYVQAKRWNDNSVGRPEVQSFVGALNGKFAKKGIFITTSNFTKDAIEYAQRLDSKVILIDGIQLAKLMVEYNIGVSTITTYEIKKVDSDYFSEE
ncbi:restriction endonuclease [Candidatus Nomurabacteria bacterium RIFCSPLOWO2_01_FULL_39_18]|uniref:Restriction endonuclease n=1 Tax=Candidatus Nomurabacteria bacterium RIFCSPHIGHO2_01_FULL_40_24b TaxID=1801739 RepID=A0A1F6V6B2_9BACT|nr:MAG: restriction endonuclease [Candidatus Nomurabacteria bacterium RIFCSPHIGHO2_01_FULL_40_24b]OGI89283.1 MAG: restriction endonuclease [Candidatus Nomurabacteria bacterium RIFCSPLOWO2_01_FULL_39_18]